MGIIQNNARVPKRWKLTLLTEGGTPGDEFQGHTSAIEFPSNETAVTWRGGDDNTITDIAQGDQVCNVTVAQDLTEGSLYRVMWDHAGEKAALEFEPEYGGEFAVAAEVTLLRPPLLTNKAGTVIEHVVALPSTVPSVVTPTP